MIDSVFDTILFAETPFPNDAPLIPVEEIQAGLDRVEQNAIAAQMTEIEREGDRVLFQGLQAVDSRDAKAINELDWGLSGALQRPIYQLWEDGFRLGGVDVLDEMRTVFPANFARFVSREVAAALRQMLQLQPAILINTAAQTAVLNRVIAIAGNFSRDLLNQLKLDLVSAIVPQPTTGQPISRRQLLDRIQNTLSVSRSRASNIARTELTNSYNSGRIASAQQSELVEAFRFLAIDDTRTTEICRSRNGMIISAADQQAIAANQPALHYRCRSTLSPVLPRVSRRHRNWMNDPNRDYRNRNLVPLAPGWNGTQPSSNGQPQTWQDFLKRGRDRYTPQLNEVRVAIATRDNAINPFADDYNRLKAEVQGALSRGDRLSKAINVGWAAVPTAKTSVELHGMNTATCNP